MALNDPMAHLAGRRDVSYVTGGLQENRWRLASRQRRLMVYVIRSARGAIDIPGPLRILTEILL